MHLHHRGGWLWEVSIKSVYINIYLKIIEKDYIIFKIHKLTLLLNYNNVLS